MRQLKIIFYLIFLLSQAVTAQGTVQDYKRAISLDTLFGKKVYNAPGDFYWIDRSSFWYVNSERNSNQYLLVNAESKSQKPAFDHLKLAKSLSVLLDVEVNPDSIAVNNLKYNQDYSNLSFTTDSLRISCNLSDYELEILGEVEKKRERNGYWGRRGEKKNGKPVKSPDEKYSAYIKDHNIFLKDLQNKKETQLSFDGTGGFYYSSNLEWSPDGKKIMAYKIRPAEEHKIYFIESSPEDQLQPKLQSRDYLKPGDRVDFRSPQLFNVENKKHIPVAIDQFENQYSLRNFKWRENSSAITFEFNQRGHQAYKILQADAETGKVSAIIEETSPTFVDYSGKKYRYDVKNRDEIIWASERDGWNHLYLYDANTGKVKNQITSGEWVVRKVVKVDEENRQIYFAASGLDKDQDPYFEHFFRVDFDGKNFKRLTTEDGNHKVSFSPDYNYYIDQYSRVDLPPVTLLKKVDSKKPLMKLQEADISELLATGWKAPEIFKAKGRDGKTDIWGIIIKPTNFDPQKTYPVIEYIYAGPHDSFVPKNFHSYYSSMSSLAELGFILVQIDGMGTSNRSKAFHDVCWKNLKDAGFPDRKLWIKAAAKKYPYINADKVGIHGTSAGGQNAGAALVFNSDFYDVAVASCGCHDNRMDKIWWNEQWMGYPVGPHYAESSNIENAAQMQGDLLLMVGEVDDNVDPASTFQFADALIKAKKDFELVVLPGMSHTSGGEFGERKRKDFFVEKLLEVTPPSWDQVYND